MSADRPARKRKASWKLEEEEEAEVVNVTPSKKKKSKAPKWVADAEGVLGKLRGHEDAWAFLHAVDWKALELPDYPEIITHPMDLGTVAKKLGHKEYAGPDAFAEDVRLVFRNAQTYNAPENEIHQMASRLSYLFERSWAKKLKGPGAEGSPGAPVSGPGPAAVRPLLEVVPALLTVEGRSRFEEVFGSGGEAKSLNELLVEIESARLPGGMTQERAAEVIAAALMKDSAASASADGYLQHLQHTRPEKLSPVEKILGDRAGEYLVKWRGRAYRHCSWEKPEAIGDDDQVAQYCRRKQLGLVTQEMRVAGDRGSAFPLEYVAVDRILEISQTQDEEEPRCLVKWKALPYAQATWERLADFGAETEAEYGRVSVEAGSLAGKQWHEIHQRFYKNGHELYKYQLVGLNWLSYNWFQRRSSVLGDATGLGKTVQAVAFMHHLVQIGVGGPFLVVAPLESLASWERVIRDWTDLVVVVYSGDAESRRIARQHDMWTRESDRHSKKKAARFHVMVTPYEALLQDDWAKISRTHWRMLVVDDAHRLAARSTKLMTTVLKTNAERRLALTNVPLADHAPEIWSVLSVIEWKGVPSQAAFLAAYGTLSTPEHVTQLADALHPCLLRRNHADVSVPPRSEIIVAVEPTALQKHYLRAVLDRARPLLAAGPSAAALPSLLDVFDRVRLIVNHPFLLPTIAEANSDVDLCAASAKLAALSALLAHDLTGRKVVVMSQIPRMLDLVERLLNSLALAYVRVDAATSRVDQADRLARFTADAGLRVFLQCARADGFFVCVPAAEAAVILDCDWTPLLDAELVSLAHRAEERTVAVYRLLVSATYEQAQLEGAPEARTVLDTAASSPTTEPQRRALAVQIETLLRQGLDQLYDDARLNLGDNLVTNPASIKSLLSPMDVPSRSDPPAFDEPALASPDEFWIKRSTESNNRRELEAMWDNRVLFPDAERDGVTATAAEKTLSEALVVQPVEVVSDGFSEDEVRRVQRTVVTWARPWWMLAEFQAQFPQRTRAQLYGCALAFLRTCETVSDGEERRVFQRTRQFYEDVDGSEAAAFDPTAAVGPFGVLARAEYQAYAAAHRIAWSRQLRVLERLRAEVLLYHDVQQLQLPKANEMGPLRSCPAQWWTHKEEVDLLRGTFVHGMGNYRAMFSDPALSLSRHGPRSAEADAGLDPDELTLFESNGDDERALDAEQMAAGTDTRRSHRRGTSAAAQQLSVSGDAAPDRSEPSAALLNTRVRVVLDAIDRVRMSSLHDAEKAKKRAEREQERARRAAEAAARAEARWSFGSAGFAKRERDEVYRVAMAVGPGRWAEVCDARKMSERALAGAEDFFQEMLMAARAQVADSTDLGRSQSERRVSGNGNGFGLSLKHAQALVERSEFWVELRAVVERTDVAELLARHVPQHMRTPVSWWMSPEMDVELLRALSRYGLIVDSWEPFFKEENAIFSSWLGSKMSMRVSTTVREKEKYLRELLAEQDELLDRASFMVQLVQSDGRSAHRPKNRLARGGAEDSLETPAVVAGTPEPPPRRATMVKFVSRDADGAPMLPLLAKGAQVTSLGTVEWQRPNFHTRQYIYPIGFSSERRLPSPSDPQRDARYRSEILDGGDAPIFRVTSLEDGQHFDHVTSSGAWGEMLGVLKNKRRVAVSGPEMFGFSDNTVRHLIQSLPNADKCALYKHVDYAEDPKDPLPQGEHASQPLLRYSGDTRVSSRKPSLDSSYSRTRRPLSSSATRMPSEAEQLQLLEQATYESAIRATHHIDLISRALDQMIRDEREKLGVPM